MLKIFLAVVFSLVVSISATTKAFAGDENYDDQPTVASESVQCLNDICVGNAVLTVENLRGTVQEVFTDGLVKVLILNRVFDYRVNQLKKFDGHFSDESDCL